MNAFLHDNILWFWLMVLLCFFIFSLNNTQAGKIRALAFFRNFKLRGRLSSIQGEVQRNTGFSDARLFQ